VAQETMLPRQSQTPSNPKSREIRKVEKERDRALGRLHKFKAKRKEKKTRRQRQTLARQVVSLTMQTTQAVIDGGI